MRRVYFCFDHARDMHRVKQFAELPGVMVSAAGGVRTATVWTEARQRGDAPVQGLINDALRGTSVTVFCIGQRTAHGKFLGHEIDQSLAQGNGLVGITINHLRDKDGSVDAEAPIPPAIQAAGFKVYRFSDKKALVKAIEEAAQIAKEREDTVAAAADATVHVSAAVAGGGPPPGMADRRGDGSGGDRRQGPRRGADRERLARRSRILKKKD